MTIELPDGLLTPRLVLRAPRMTDAVGIFNAYTQDAQVARHMVWRPHATLGETEGFVTHCMQAWDDGRSRPYVLAFQDDHAVPIGMIEARVLAHSLDIGYVLARSYWGAGLMPEALTALTDAALALPNCFRVQATCDVNNLASVRTLEKSGFQCEGRLERYVVLPNVSDEPGPCFMDARFR